MKRIIALILNLTMCLTLFTPLMGRAEDTAPAKPIVRAVDVQGYKFVSQEDQNKAKQLLKIQVGQPFEKDVADGDVESILREGWFYNAFYRTEPQDDGVRVIFTVVENPVIEKISFSGNTALSGKDLQAVLQMQSGKVLNQNQVSSDALRIKQAYAAKGFTQVQIVDLKVSDKNELTYVIFEPKIGEVRIQSDKKSLKTRDYVINRELLFRVGDVFNENTITESLRSLDRLGIFQEVKAIPEPGTEPGTLAIVVQVTEKRTGMAGLGVGHDNIKGLIGFVDVSDSNLVGSGQKVSARVQFGADSSYEMSYTNPWLGQQRTGLTANVYNRTTLRQAIQENETHLYDEKRIGENLTLSRPWSKDYNTHAYLTFRNDRIRATEDNNTPLPVGLQGLLEPSDVRSVAISMVRDTRDNFLNPTSGRYASAGLEVAGLGGAKFNKLTAEMRRYWVVKNNQKSADAKKKKAQPWIFASRLSAGAITGAPPFLDQFLTGGADTLRGYKEDRFPGVHSLLMNNELRIPLNESLQFVTFVDVGDAWGGRFAAGFGDPSFSLHAGYGAGVRVQTPIGPIRLDYALNNEGGREFHFGIGSTF